MVKQVAIEYFENEINQMEVMFGGIQSERYLDYLNKKYVLYEIALSVVKCMSDSEFEELIGTIFCKRRMYS